VSEEKDRIIAEALGWTNFACWHDVDDYWGVRPGAKGDLECREKLPAYTSNEGDALEGIKALVKKGWAAKILIDENGTSLELTPPDQYALDMWWASSLAAAFGDSLIEVVNGKPLLRDEIAAALKEWK